MYNPVLPLRFSLKDLPVAGEYRVCDVLDATGIMIACITQYGDGRRTYEFDKEVLYPPEAVGELMGYSVPLRLKEQAMNEQEWEKFFGLMEKVVNDGRPVAEKLKEVRAKAEEIGSTTELEEFGSWFAE